MDESTAVYVRVATAGSADDQRERALAYAEAELGLDPAAVSVFTDSGVEMRADQSSDYRELLSLAADGEFDRIVVTDASRIAKTMPDFYELAETLLANDVALHVVDVGLCLGERAFDATGRSTPDDEQVLDAIGIAADLAASITAERTREGIDAAKKSGKHVGRPPFGFDSENGQLVPNDDFEVALDVIERIEAGKSKRSTAQHADISRATVQNVVERADLYRTHTDVSRG